MADASEVFEVPAGISSWELALAILGCLGREFRGEVLAADVRGMTDASFLVRIQAPSSGRLGDASRETAGSGSAPRRS